MKSPQTYCTTPLNNGTLERLLQKDRAIVLTALGLAILLAWLYLLAMWLGMSNTSQSMGAMGNDQWTLLYFFMMFAMWTIMMVGMMLPSACPMILLYAKARREHTDDHSISSAALFTLGYLLIWTTFSALATVLQYALEQSLLVSPMMKSQSKHLNAMLLVSIGIYQLLPLKRACLIQCSSPIKFIQQYWHLTPLKIGYYHGLYCVGCCWALMLLLFVAGVMDLFWVAMITIYVLIEKWLQPDNDLLRDSAIVFIAAGFGLMW
jgi:predicted metal-binding membrane protein